MQLPDLLQLPYMVLQHPVCMPEPDPLWFLPVLSRVFTGVFELISSFPFHSSCNLSAFSLIVMVFILSNAFILFLHYNSNFDILNQDAYFRMQEGQYHVTVHTVPLIYNTYTYHIA